MYSNKNVVEQGIGQVLLSSLINYIIIGSLKFTSCFKLPLDNCTCTVISFNIILSNCMYIGNWHIVVSTQYCIGYHNIIIPVSPYYTCEW